MKLEFSRQFFRNSHVKIMKIRRVRADMLLADRRMETHDGANSPFSQLRELARKLHCFP